MATTAHHTVSGWTGWVAFAGVAIFISGLIHIMYGIAGIFAYDWYISTASASYVMSTTAWGWSMLFAGVLLLVAAGLLVSGNIIGRVAGVLLAAVGIIANLAIFPAAPIWSIIAIVLNAVVIYAIIAHGAEMKELKEG